MLRAWSERACPSAGPEIAGALDDGLPVGRAAGGATLAQYWVTLSPLAEAAALRFLKATGCLPACDPIEAAYAVHRP